ncbi:hypothetical protein LTR51_005029 [Lithohypha guttulata]|nr:hypothetical protein LTR51_005029 [Lithohypha guttulata]
MGDADTRESQRKKSKVMSNKTGTELARRPASDGGANLPENEDEDSLISPPDSNKKPKRRRRRGKKGQGAKVKIEDSSTSAHDTTKPPPLTQTSPHAHDNVPEGETEVMPDKDIKLEDTKKQKGRLPLSDTNPINKPESANEVKHEPTSDGTDEDDWEDMSDEGYY